MASKKKKKKKGERMPNAALMDRAVAWAHRCGFVDGQATHVAQEDWGYSVIVQEPAGKKRRGTAKFNREGKPTMWTVDGVPGI